MQLCRQIPLLGLFLFHKASIANFIFQDLLSTCEALPSILKFFDFLQKRMAHYKMDASRNYTLAIVGGGIGGLCTAIGLLKQGINVEIYEGMGKT